MPSDDTLGMAALIFLSFSKPGFPEFAFSHCRGHRVNPHFLFVKVTRGTMLPGRVRKAPLEDERLEKAALHLALPRPPGLRHRCHERARKRAVSGTEGGDPAGFHPYWPSPGPGRSFCGLKRQRLATS